MKQSSADQSRGVAPSRIRASLNAEEGNEALARWKLRHGLPDALTRWHEAGPGQGGPFAFAAIVQDPHLLTRMQISVASLVVHDAVDHAESLTAALKLDINPLAPAAAAVAHVQLAAATWQASLGRKGGANLFRPKRQTAQRVSSVRLLKNAGHKAFDCFDEREARETTEVVARLGAQGLAELALQDARVLAGNVTRLVGSRLLSAPSQVNWNSVQSALSSLQEHAAHVGTDLFLTDNYQSDVLAPGAVAARLSADLAICGAAMQAVGGGERSLRLSTVGSCGGGACTRCSGA